MRSTKSKKAQEKFFQTPGEKHRAQMKPCCWGRGIGKMHPLVRFWSVGEQKGVKKEERKNGRKQNQSWQTRNARTKVVCARSGNKKLNKIRKKVRAVVIQRRRRKVSAPGRVGGKGGLCFWENGKGRANTLTPDLGGGKKSRQALGACEAGPDFRERKKTKKKKSGNRLGGFRMARGKNKKNHKKATIAVKEDLKMYRSKFESTSEKRSGWGGPRTEGKNATTN